MPRRGTLCRVTDTFRVPQPFIALWENRQYLDIFPDEFASLSDLADPAEQTLYHGEPIELVPFGTSGVAGLRYSWVVLAPELDLDDHPCVSFSPEDEVVWLGDDTRQALENLLVGQLASGQDEEERLRQRAAKRGATVPAGNGVRSPADDPRWASLCEALELRPETGSPRQAWKARWDRSIRPTVPPGWRYEPGGEGIGVLAEIDAFAPDPFTIDPDWYGEVSAEHAQQVLQHGYPATALCILKETHCGEPGVVETMRAAYEALGRTLHVARADAWLREWAEESP